MSSSLTLLGTLIILLNIFISPVEAVVAFKIGEDEGWHNPGMDNTELYSQWTATKKFHVGDSLVFEYKNDSVLVVSKWGYYHCDTTKPSSVFIDGNTSLVLDNPGEFYFVSGDPSHCKEGQRLFINVLPLHRYIATDPLRFPANSPAPSLPTKSGSSAVSVTVVSLIVAPAMWLVFSEVYFISKISNSHYLL